MRIRRYVTISFPLGQTSLTPRRCGYHFTKRVAHRSRDFMNSRTFPAWMTIAVLAENEDRTVQAWYDGNEGIKKEILTQML